HKNVKWAAGWRHSNACLHTGVIAMCYGIRMIVARSQTLPDPRIQTITKPKSSATSRRSMLKRLLFHAQQLHQRRMSVFWLLPKPLSEDDESAMGQLRLKSLPEHEDRPRTLREMFSDQEYDENERPG